MYLSLNIFIEKIPMIKRSVVPFFKWEPYRALETTQWNGHLKEAVIHYFQIFVDPIKYMMLLFACGLVMLATAASREAISRETPEGTIS